MQPNSVFECLLGVTEFEAEVVDAHSSSQTIPIERIGVFTDDLNRSRHDLASNFEASSARMTAVTRGTDIFGGLWRLKALFETKSETSSSVSKTIWIFSDMMNETQDFSMPSLIEKGPTRMLEQARAQGLLVPLKGYKIHIRGSSTNGLTPQIWVTLKQFWTVYFSAAGAELLSYSAQCDSQR